MLKSYESCRLTANVSYFALTTDMWPSRTCEPYMSVTIHIMDNWEMQSACLQTSYISEDHTGKNIAGALQDVLTSWNLNPTGLVAITTDNGSNVVKAVQQVAEDAVFWSPTSSGHC